MKVLLTIASSLLLSSCISLSDITRTVTGGARASKDVNTGIAIKSAGKAIKSIGGAIDKNAQAKVIMAKNAALKIEKTANIRQITISAINSLDKEANKVQLSNHLMTLIRAKNRQEHMTKRAQYWSDARFWGILGMLLGFLLSVLLRTLSNAVSRVRGVLKFDPKK